MTKWDELRGRLAVVTGAGSGIGRALAEGAASRGLTVLGWDVNQVRLAEVSAAVEAAGGQMATGVVDVSDYAAVEAAAEVAQAAYGPAALIVNNAGIEFTGPMWETDPKTWHRVTGVNINGPFNVTRAFLGPIVESGAPAHVVMLSSVGGLSTGAGQSAYIASRFATLAMALCLRDDLEQAGARVGVSTVLPGPVRTNIFKDARSGGTAGSAQRRELVDMLDRHGMEPADVADLVYAAVENDRFWVHTHPEMSRDAIERQYAELLSAF